VLRNTLITLSDNKIGVDNNADNKADFYQASVLSATDYYAFGMSMKERSWQSESYRYGFNGKENDTDWDVQDYGFRIYKPELGKFLSVDPLSASYPWYTPYQFAGNKPIEAIDLDGLEDWSSKDGKQALDSKGKPVLGPISNEEQNKMSIYQKAQGGAFFNLYNSMVRLKYASQVSALKHLYSPFEVTENHRFGVDERVRLKDLARNNSFGNRSFLDKIEPINSKYTSTKPWYQTYYEYDMGIDPPNQPQNPRFFKTNLWVNRFTAFSGGMSAINLTLTGVRLHDAQKQNRLGEQTVIEGGGLAGAWAGMKIGGSIMLKTPIKHPVIGLIGVGVFTAIGSIAGASAVEQIVAPKVINTKIDTQSYEKKLLPSSDYQKSTNE